MNLYNPNDNSFNYYINDPGSDVSISGNNIISIFEDSFGKLWVGTLNGGLNLFVNAKDRPDNGKFIQYKHDISKPDFITIDGRPGATAFAPKFVKDST